MFDVKKPKQKQIVVIRAATGNELSNYEKRKLANIEAKAQENKIEVIKVNGQSVQVDPLNKEVNIKPQFRNNTKEVGDNMIKIESIIHADITYEN